MTIAIAILLVLLLGVLTLASYAGRVYTERGKFLSREFQENVEAYELRVEPRLGNAAGRAELSMAVLTQLTTGGIALLGTFLVMKDGNWSGMEVVQVVLALALAVIVFNQLLPFIFFTRTKGEWVESYAPIIRLFVYLMLPITVVLGFCLQIAALAEKNEPVENETQAEAVEALIEAGQEEGILEESDRELIQSVVEFRDKTVREVMTPRPEITAVPMDMTVEALTELMRQKPYSRIPVYDGSIDKVKGLVFAHDVLQVADVDAKTKVVYTMMKPVHFVPETKPVQELMREMQKNKVHLAIVTLEDAALLVRTEGVAQRGNP